MKNAMILLIKCWPNYTKKLKQLKKYFISSKDKAYITGFQNNKDIGIQQRLGYIQVDLKPLGSFAVWTLSVGSVILQDCAGDRISIGMIAETNASWEEESRSRF